MFDREDWLASHQEDIIDPDRPIIDPHHHLWAYPQFGPYLLENLWGDTSSGHNIKKTVYIECGWAYDTDAEKSLQSLGETKFIADVAEQSAKDPSKAQIAGHIGHVDLCHDNLDDLLDKHVDASKNLLRGIRHHGASDTEEALLIKPDTPPHLYLEADYQRGVKTLGKRGLTFDSWNFHHQIPELTALAQACPDTTIILDHFGTPLGVGGYTGKRDEIMAQWKIDVAELAKCPNVHAKLGGYAMPDNGWAYHERPVPPSSDDFVSDQADWYHYTIDQFGPSRCMFESNFPVDRASISYHVLWNAFKKIAANYSEDEKQAMFWDTAESVYSL